MAKPNDTSKARPSRNSDSPVIEAIEQERNRLMQAESLLDCMLAAAGEDEGDPESPYLPNVIQLARDLIHQSIDQLDSIKVRPLLAAYPAADERSGLGADFKVKEPAAVYLVQ